MDDTMKEYLRDLDDEGREHWVKAQAGIEMAHIEEASAIIAEMAKVDASRLTPMALAAMIDEVGTEGLEPYEIWAVENFAKWARISHQMRRPIEEVVLQMKYNLLREI